LLRSAASQKKPICSAARISQSSTQLIAFAVSLVSATKKMARRRLQLAAVLALAGFALAHVSGLQDGIASIQALIKLYTTQSNRTSCA
jgi:hypothetical protein